MAELFNVNLYALSDYKSAFLPLALYEVYAQRQQQFNYSTIQLTYRLETPPDTMNFITSLLGKSI